MNYLNISWKYLRDEFQIAQRNIVVNKIKEKTKKANIKK